MVPIGEPAFLCSTRNGVTCHLLLPVRSTAYQRRWSTSSFGELEELGFGQLWQIQLLRKGAEAVLLDDLSAIRFHGEANNLSLQIERLFGFDSVRTSRTTALGF